MSDRSIVLVVEDEPLLRLYAEEMMEAEGFTMLAVGSSDEAVVILEERTDIRIVLADIDMPDGLDGMKLAATIRDRWPPIEIIIVSGKPFPSEARLPARAVFFPKPFLRSQIVAAMKAMGAVARAASTGVSSVMP